MPISINKNSESGHGSVALCSSTSDSVKQMRLFWGLEGVVTVSGSDSRRKRVPDVRRIVTEASFANSNLGRWFVQSVTVRWSEMAGWYVSCMMPVEGMLVGRTCTIGNTVTPP